MDELSSQVIANKAQALDMQSHVFTTLDGVKDKLQNFHMQLAGQLHANTEWSHSFRMELGSKADKALDQVTLELAGHTARSTPSFATACL